MTIEYRHYKICIDILRREIETPTHFISTRDGQLLVAAYKALAKQRYHWQALHAKAAKSNIPELHFHNFYCACVLLHNINKGELSKVHLSSKMHKKIAKACKMAPQRKQITAPEIKATKGCSDIEITKQVLKSIPKIKHHQYDMDSIFHYCKVLYKKHLNKNTYAFKDDKRYIGVESYWTKRFLYNYTKDWDNNNISKVLDAMMMNPYSIPDMTLFKGLLVKANKIINNK